MLGFAMSHKLILTKVGFLTAYDRANVRSLLDMPSLVVFSISTHRESLSAENAQVRFDLRVHPLMNLDDVRSKKLTYKKVCFTIIYLVAHQSRHWVFPMTVMQSSINLRLSLFR